MKNEPTTQILSTIFKRVALAVLSLIIIIPVIILISAFKNHDQKVEADFSVLRSEIERVESVSNVTASSINCRTVEFAPICYVDYGDISYSAVNEIFEKSGYKLENTTSTEEPTTGESISAYNEITQVEVDGERTGGKTGVTIIKFKNNGVGL